MSDDLGHDDIAPDLLALDNAKEEPAALPGGWSPERIKADLERADTDRARVLASPQTDDEREAAELYRTALAARAADTGLAGLAPRERRMAIAIYHERAASEMLAGLESQQEAPDYASRFGLVCLGLANALFHQGRFEEAIHFCPVGERDHLHQFSEYLAADMRADDEMCACTTDHTFGTHDAAGNPAAQLLKISLPAHNVEGEFLRQGVWKVAIRCGKCGHLNVRAELTEQAAALLNARANANGDAIALSRK